MQNLEFWVRICVCSVAPASEKLSHQASTSALPVTADVVVLWTNRMTSQESELKICWFSEQCDMCTVQLQIEVCSSDDSISEFQF